MSLASSTEPSSDINENLHQLAELPDWLAAAGNGARVAAALEHDVAEFASGALTIRRCKVDSLRLKDEQWIARYELTIEEPAGPVREQAIVGTLTPAGRWAPAREPSGAFGTTEWRGELPELGLDLRMDLAEEEEFEALPVLTDPQQARAFLQQSIRANAPAYAEIEITACTPKVMRNKPGRCTVRYQLEYAGDGSARWPNPIIAKTYSKNKGQNAYTAMRKLWESPLLHSDVVAIAEPLAYVHEHKVLVQGPVRGTGDLKDLLRATLRADSPDALEELHALTRKTAAGLVALHHSGARHGETLTWEDELAEIRGELNQLSASIPWFASAIEPLLAQLEADSAATPAEAMLPAHRSFRPQQVLLDHGNIGFIDFDGFCLAEPALDIALFRATIKEIGINTAPAEKQKEFNYPSEQARLARLTELNTICDIFLDEYARLAPISRQRVALWEALDLLTVLLHCWSKVKPHQLSNAILLLGSQLSASVLPAE
jgi:aminoglycoside phosphotransferase (APT) family kinase protein